MQKILVFFLVFFLAPIFLLSSEPIYHKVQYPTGDKKFPAVILLHTSGGFKTVRKQIPKYIKNGFAVYAPDFFKKHGISSSNRMETFDEYTMICQSFLNGKSYKILNFQILICELKI